MWVTLFYKEPELICLDTVKSFQVLLFIVCTQLNDFKHYYFTIMIIQSKILHSSILLIDGTLTSSWSGAGSDKGYSTFPQTSRLEPHHQKQINVIWRTLFGSNRCLKIISIRLEYLKPYNYVPTNDHYHQKGIVTWNHIKASKMNLDIK